MRWSDVKQRLLKSLFFLAIVVFLCPSASQIANTFEEDSATEISSSRAEEVVAVRKRRLCDKAAKHCVRVGYPVVRSSIPTPKPRELHTFQRLSPIIA